MVKKILNAFVWLLWLAAFVAVATVVFAQINRFADKPITMPPETLTGKTQLFKQAAPIFQESCLPCHSHKTQLPWYASLPVAKQIIEHDIEEALEEGDLEKALFTPGKAPSVKALHKIKSVIQEGEMPPLEYAALHWNAFISAKEKQTLLDWIEEQRNAGVKN